MKVLLSMAIGGLIGLGIGTTIVGRINSIYQTTREVERSPIEFLISISAIGSVTGAIISK